MSSTPAAPDAEEASMATVSAIAGLGSASAAAPGPGSRALSPAPSSARAQSRAGGDARTQSRAGEHSAIPSHIVPRHAKHVSEKVQLHNNKPPTLMRVRSKLHRQPAPKAQPVRARTPLLPFEQKLELVDPTTNSPKRNRRKMVPYRLQGDHTMYTEENLAIRETLRQHIDVQHVLETYWNTFHHRDSTQGLSREEYIAVHTRIGKALASKSEPFDAEMARELAAADWQRDVARPSQASLPDPTRLGREAFLDALYEIVDIWTISLDPTEYVTFLQTLYLRITRFNESSQGWHQQHVDFDGSGSSSESLSSEEPTPPASDDEAEAAGGAGAGEGGAGAAGVGAGAGGAADSASAENRRDLQLVMELAQQEEDQLARELMPDGQLPHRSGAGAASHNRLQHAEALKAAQKQQEAARRAERIRKRTEAAAAKAAAKAARSSDEEEKKQTAPRRKKKAKRRREEADDDQFARERDWAPLGDVESGMGAEVAAVHAAKKQLLAQQEAPSSKSQGQGKGQSQEGDGDEHGDADGAAAFKVVVTSPQEQAGGRDETKEPAPLNVSELKAQAFRSLDELVAGAQHIKKQPGWNNLEGWALIQRILYPKKRAAAKRSAAADDAPSSPGKSPSLRARLARRGLVTSLGLAADKDVPADQLKLPQAMHAVPAQASRASDAAADAAVPVDAASRIDSGAAVSSAASAAVAVDAKADSQPVEAQSTKAAAGVESSAVQAVAESAPADPHADDHADADSAVHVVIAAPYVPVKLAASSSSLPPSRALDSEQASAAVDTSSAAAAARTDQLLVPQPAAVVDLSHESAIAQAVEAGIEAARSREQSEGLATTQAGFDTVAASDSSAAAPSGDPPDKAAGDGGAESKEAAAAGDAAERASNTSRRSSKRPRAVDSAGDDDGQDEAARRAQFVERRRQRHERRATMTELPAHLKAKAWQEHQEALWEQQNEQETLWKYKFSQDHVHALMSAHLQAQHHQQQFVQQQPPGRGLHGSDAAGRPAADGKRNMLLQGRALAPAGGAGEGSAGGLPGSSSAAALAPADQEQPFSAVLGYSFQPFWTRLAKRMPPTAASVAAASSKSRRTRQPGVAAGGDPAEADDVTDLAAADQPSEQQSEDTEMKGFYSKLLQHLASKPKQSQPLSSRSQAPPAKSRHRRSHTIALKPAASHRKDLSEAFVGLLQDSKLVAPLPVAEPATDNKAAAGSRPAARGVTNHSNSPRGPAPAGTPSRRRSPSLAASQPPRQHGEPPQLLLGESIALPGAGQGSGSDSNSPSKLPDPAVLLSGSAPLMVTKLLGGSASPAAAREPRVVLPPSHSGPPSGASGHGMGPPRSRSPAFNAASREPRVVLPPAPSAGHSHASDTPGRRTAIDYSARPEPLVVESPSASAKVTPPRGEQQQQGSGYITIARKVMLHASQPSLSIPRRTPAAGSVAGDAADPAAEADSEQKQLADALQALSDRDTAATGRDSPDSDQGSPRRPSQQDRNVLRHSRSASAVYVSPRQREQGLWARSLQARTQSPARRPLPPSSQLWHEQPARIAVARTLHFDGNTLFGAADASLVAAATAVPAAGPMHVRGKSLVVSQPSLDTSAVASSKPNLNSPRGRQQQQQLQGGPGGSAAPPGWKHLRTQHFNMASLESPGLQTRRAAGASDVGVKGSSGSSPPRDRPQDVPQDVFAAALASGSMTRAASVPDLPVSPRSLQQRSAAELAAARALQPVAGQLTLASAAPMSQRQYLSQVQSRSQTQLRPAASLAAAAAATASAEPSQPPRMPLAPAVPRLVLPSVSQSIVAGSLDTLRLLKHRRQHAPVDAAQVQSARTAHSRRWQAPVLDTPVALGLHSRSPLSERQRRRLARALMMRRWQDQPRAVAAAGAGATAASGSGVAFGSGSRSDRDSHHLHQQHSSPQEAPARWVSSTGLNTRAAPQPARSAVAFVAFNFPPAQSAAAGAAVLSPRPPRSSPPASTHATSSSAIAVPLSGSASAVPMASPRNLLDERQRLAAAMQSPRASAADILAFARSELSIGGVSAAASGPAASGTGGRSAREAAAPPVPMLPRLKAGSTLSPAAS